MKTYNKNYATAYKYCRFWLLLVFIMGLTGVIVYGFLGVFLPILSGFSLNSILSAELLFDEAIQSGLMPEEECFYFIYIGIAMAIGWLVPYLLSFFFSARRFGWMKASFVLYLIESILSLSFFISSILTEDFVFYLAMFAIHLVGITVLSFALYYGGRIFPKRPKYGYNEPFGNGAFSTLRTLCLVYDERNSYTSVTFTYHINGVETGQLSYGQTGIAVVDGNYQRIVVTAPGCQQKETVLPAGTENASLGLGTYLDDRGEICISVLPR